MYSTVIFFESGGKTSSSLSYNDYLICFGPSVLEMNLQFSVVLFMLTYLLGDTIVSAVKMADVVEISLHMPRQCPDIGIGLMRNDIIPLK